MKYFYFDTEFRNTENPNVDPICMAFSANGAGPICIWCYNDSQGKEEIREILLAHKDHVFVSYSVEAETRFLTSLGLDPFKFKWFDLMLEYRMMLNHDHSIMYGNQLINGKKVKTHPPASWGVEDDLNHARPEYSLSACTYKLLDTVIDTKEKTQVRDLIINQEVYSVEERNKILDYCRSDIRYLRDIHGKVGDFYQRRGIRGYPDFAIERAKYAVLSGIRSDMGYSFDLNRTKAFSKSVKSILNSCIRDIISQFPGMDLFAFKRKTESFSRKMGNIREWISASEFSDVWPRTPSGIYSISEPAFSKLFPFKHDFPRGNVGAQLLRLLRLQKSLNGFLPSSGYSRRKTFWDFVGPDQRARPFMNIFGSQSGRTQPGATGYLLLKSAWMRVLLSPPKGKAILSLDYSGQEFLLAGILSNDEKMIEAYNEQDVYLHIAKILKIAPEGSTKQTHPVERETIKTAMLGIIYGMTKTGLSRSLTAKLGKTYSEDMAQEFIDNIMGIFSEFAKWRYAIVQEYSQKGYLATPDHWYLFGDNQNNRSVANFPLQGLGASIMREADLRAYARGLKVPMTLHDALYAEIDLEHPQREIELLINSMQEGFKKFCPKHTIKIDGKLWSPEITEEYILDFDGTKVDICKEHIDERSIREYNFFLPFIEEGSFNL